MHQSSSLAPFRPRLGTLRLIMSSPEPNAAPSSPPILGIFLVALAVLLASQPMQGGDQYWHLSVGRWLWDHGSIPWIDPFSFTAGTRPFTPHALLFDFVLEGFSRLAGLAGVRLARGLLPLGFGLSLYYGLLLPRLRQSPRMARWIAVLTVACSLDLGIPRPYWMPLIFIPWLWRWVDETIQSDPQFAPSVLPYFLLSWLWAWTHGSVILALVIPATALVCDGYSLGLAKSKRLAAAAASAFLATFLTAHGTGIWRYLVAVSQNKWHVESGFVSEWMAPTLWGPTWEVHAALSVFLGLALWRRRQGPRWELLWTFVWVTGYFQYLRQLGLALMAGSVLAAEALGQAPCPPGSSSGAPKQADRPPQDLRDAWIGLGGALLLTLGITLFPTVLPTPHVDPGLIPTRELDAWLESTPHRRIFHRFHWGGYISWKSNHRIKSFFDGRVILFGKQIHQDYQTILMAKPDWEEAFDRYHFDAVLLIETAPILEALKARGDFQEADFPHPNIRLLERKKDRPNAS